MSISAPIGAAVDQEGEIAVPARILTDLVGALHSEKIALSSKGEILKVESESFKADVAGLNVSDFPDIPGSAENTMVLPKDDFIKAIGSVIFSTSPDDTRPALSGVLMILLPESLSLVSSDGFRLSKKEIPTKGNLSVKAIIPKNILIELQKIAAEAKKLSVSVRENDKQIVFMADDIVVSSRLVEGEYPPFEKIIPQTSSISVSVSKADFQGAIRLAAVFARDGANIVNLHLEEGSVVVKAESARSGSQEGVIPAKVDGPALDIMFNYRYIEEFLNITKGESVVMKYNSPTASGLFLDASDEKYLHLIMPVKS
jgi:DNA polymerase-3 subunit beta